MVRFEKLHVQIVWRTVYLKIAWRLVRFVSQRRRCWSGCWGGGWGESGRSGALQKRAAPEWGSATAGTLSGNNAGHGGRRGAHSGRDCQGRGEMRSVCYGKGHSVNAHCAGITAERFYCHRVHCAPLALGDVRYIGVNWERKGSTRGLVMRVPFSILTALLHCS